MHRRTALSCPASYLAVPPPASRLRPMRFRRPRPALAFARLAAAVLRLPFTVWALRGRRARLLRAFFPGRSYGLLPRRAA